MEMPRPRWPFLHKTRTRHGNIAWYVRSSMEGRKRVRIRSTFGTPEFEAEYKAAIGGGGPKPSVKSQTGTLLWLYERYQDSGAWLNGISKATRRQRKNILGNVMKAVGHEPFASITKQSVIDSREARVKTPAQARNFLDAMRGLFEWAVEAQHIDSNPTQDVKNPSRPKGKGFPIWTEEEVERYEAKWPVGTKERVWFDVLLYTGLRRGDAVRLGKQHVRNGIATLKTEKSQEDTLVSIPILPVLARTIAAGPCAELAFICGDAGKPLKKESFGNFFRIACNEAGVTKSAHGLRKIGATRAANNGATVSQLKAIFGWRSDAMAAHYTKNADRAHLAKQAMHLLIGTSMDPPDKKVSPSGGKDQ